MAEVWGRGVMAWSRGAGSWRGIDLPDALTQWTSDMATLALSGRGLGGSPSTGDALEGEAGASERKARALSALIESLETGRGMSEQNLNALIRKCVENGVLPDGAKEVKMGNYTLLMLTIAAYFSSIGAVFSAASAEASAPSASQAATARTELAELGDAAFMTTLTSAYAAASEQTALSYGDKFLEAPVLWQIVLPLLTGAEDEGTVRTQIASLLEAAGVERDQIETLLGGASAATAAAMNAEATTNNPSPDSVLPEDTSGQALGCSSSDSGGANVPQVLFP